MGAAKTLYGFSAAVRAVREASTIGKGRRLACFVSK